MNDHYEPSDQRVGLVERRMLYLLSSMTFEEYYDRPYHDVLLNNHLVRISSMPPAIQDPAGAENLTDTANRMDSLRNILLQNKYKGKSLARLCQTVSNTSDPALWAATAPVEQKKIFVPYYHSHDHGAASDVFGKYGFLNPAAQGGWAEEPLENLFKNPINSLNPSDPMDHMRLTSLEKAKTACVVRPHL